MKENYFFKHDFNARTDPKLQAVLMEMGLSGIGMYWCIVEQLYEQGGELPLTSVKSIAFALHAEADEVKRLINDFGLFKKDKKKFWSESINRRITDRENLSEKRRAAIKQRWEKEKNDTKNTNATDGDTNVSDGDTNVLHGTKSCDTKQSTDAIQCNRIKIKIEDKDKDKECVNIARTHEGFFERFFRADNKLRLDTLCADFGTDIETVKRVARQIVNEWALTEQSHKDYNDASRHLISLLEKRLPTDKKAEKKGEGDVCQGSWSYAEEEEKHRKRMEQRKNCISHDEYLKIKAAES